MGCKTLFIATMLAIALLAGCAPTAFKPVGPVPTLAQSKDAIIKYVKKNYYDPYSIRSAKIAYPIRYQNAFVGSGWAVCAKFNAKNRAGGYTGTETELYLIRYGKVVATGVFAGECKDLAPSYKPFEELEEID